MNVSTTQNGAAEYDKAHPFRAGKKRTEKILKEIDLLKRNIVMGALRGKRGTNAPKEKCEVI